MLFKVAIHSLYSTVSVQSYVLYFYLLFYAHVGHSFAFTTVETDFCYIHLLLTDMLVPIFERLLYLLLCLDIGLYYFSKVLNIIYLLNFSIFYFQEPCESLIFVINSIFSKEICSHLLDILFQNVDLFYYHFLFFLKGSLTCLQMVDSSI